MTLLGFTELMTQASSKEMVPQKTRNVQPRVSQRPKANKALSNMGSPLRVYTFVPGASTDMNE